MSAIGTAPLPRPLRRAHASRMMKHAVLLLSTSLLLACGPDGSEPGGRLAAASPRSEASAAPFEQQAAAGGAYFGQRCATCHGARGEGRSAPRLVGLEQGALGSFESAREVADFVLANMPPSGRGTVTQDDAYDVVAFLLRENGIDAKEALDPVVAQRIPFR